MRRVAVSLLLVVTGLWFAAEARGGKYALVVGVNDYDHAALPPLEFAENDAEEMAKTLTAGGFRVTLLTTRQGQRHAAARPTADAIRKAVAALLAERTRHDTVLLSLSGHGVQLEVDDPDGKERPRTFPYFCPTDADTARSGIRFDTGAARRLINLNSVFADLADCGAGVKLVFIDACRNQQKAAVRSRNLNLKSVSVPEGVGALFSCAAGQVAYEVSGLGGRGHGLFFHCVLEGLRGKAGNDRGEVRWAALADYVTTRVTREGARLVGDEVRQTPQLVANLVGESPLLLTVARAGEAAFRRGLARYLGTGVKIDHPSALKDLEDATADGHRMAQAWLAMALFDGAAGQKDGERAQRLAAAVARQVRTEAEAGDAVAQNLLGAMHRRGLGVTRSDTEAARWYRQAADQGLPLAQNNLGTLHGDGIGVAKDAAAAVRLFRQAADAGLPIGRFNLGWMYLNGHGVAKDPAEAVRWYRLAAEQNFPSAQVALGWACADGRGVPRDEAEAVRWFRRATDQGTPYAEYSLGRMYAEGRGVDRNDSRAVEWLCKAAGQNVADAQLLLGTMYADGRGVPRDDTEAVRWLRKAALQNLPAAQCHLGTLYRQGRGVPKDDAEAVRWYRLAAEQGWAEGQYCLGMMYARGWGVKHDPDEAQRWLRKSANQGYEYARKALYPPPMP